MTRPRTVMNRWGRDLVPPHSLAPQSPCEANGCPNEGVAWQYGLWLCPIHIDGSAAPYIGTDGRLYVPPANTFADRGWEIRDVAPKTAKLVDTIQGWRLYLGRAGRQYAVQLNNGDE